MDSGNLEDAMQHSTNMMEHDESWAWENGSMALFCGVGVKERIF